MNRMLRNLLLALLCLTGVPTWGAEKSELVLGVFPYVSPVQLAAFHTPLRDALANRLQRPVTLVTAPDFQSFVERTRKGDYDVIVTAPHLGRLAETRDGYQRIARTAHTVQGVFLTRRASPLQRIEDLKGHSVMVAQKTSIIYQMAEQLLRDKGLVPGKDVTIIETRTHNNAMHAPLRGEAEASVTGTLLWRVLQEDQKGQLRIIAETEEAPGFMVMANKRMSADDIGAIRTLLLTMHEDPANEPYFAATGFERFLKIDDKTMRRMDPYTRVLQKPSTQ